MLGTISSGTSAATKPTAGFALHRASAVEDDNAGNPMHITTRSKVPTKATQLKSKPPVHPSQRPSSDLSDPDEEVWEDFGSAVSRLKGSQSATRAIQFSSSKMKQKGKKATPAAPDKSVSLWARLADWSWTSI